MRLVVCWGFADKDECGGSRESRGVTEAQVAIAREQLCMIEMSTLPSKNCNDAARVQITLTLKARAARCLTTSSSKSKI